MELESKITQLYKTISQKPRTVKEIISSRANSANSPLYFLERVANYLVKNNLIGNYFQQTDFDKLQLDPNILLEIGNSIDSEIEQLSDFKLRKFCKKFIDLFFAIPRISIELTKRKSNNYYDFIIDLVKPSPNQIIYKPDCHLGSLFIRFNRVFPEYNLKFIGQASSFESHSFICKINLFANGLEKVSSIYSEDPLDISTSQIKAKADIAIATNYLQKSPTRKEYNLSQFESFEKICTLEVAYIELMLAMTKDNGKVIAVIPDSFLVNNESKSFRKKYLENDLVETIIRLPTTSIIVFNKEKSSENKGFVMFDGKDDDRFEETKVSIDEILSTDNCDLQVVSYASKERKKEIEERKKDIKEVGFILANSQYPVKQVKDLVEFSTSGHYHSLNDEVVENSSEILPYVRVSDLVQNRDEFDLDISKVERKISREKANEKTIIDFSAVLVVAFALNLRRTYFKFTGQPIVIDSNIIALKMKEDVNVEHFLLQLHSRLVQIQVKTMISGKTSNRITKEDFLNIQIILPPLAEQKRQIWEMRGVIEEKALVEEKLIDAQFDVVASINHSLKNKLAVIINDYDTLVRFLRRKERNSGTIVFSDAISANAVGDDIDTIEIITSRLKINLSDASKVFNNALKIQRQNLKKDVVELVKFFKEEVKPLYAGKNFSLEVNVKPNLKLNIWLDKDAFKDVIENLIENAKSHGFIDEAKNYRIVFELSELKDDDVVDDETSTKFARIIYKNDGEPFPKNFSFEDYKQFLNKASKSQGTGIGGYVINKIIELHDGRFNFLTPSDDFAVEFEILLPLEN